MADLPQRDRKELVTNTPRQTLKILHTADVHLGLDGYVADPQTQRYRDIIHQAFRTIIDLTIEENVDLLLIAGDLFDSNRPSGDVVDFAIQELRRAGRPIVMIPGNHDCLNAQSIYRQVNLPAACSNLLLMAHPDGERHQLAAPNLVLWGRGMVEHEPAYHPLGAIPRPKGDAWHIALGHGFFMEEDVPSYRSSPIYAEEIRASGWDYVALGHCHAFADVSQGAVTAYYAGAPGFYPGVPGADGHVALVRFEAGASRHVDVQRIDLRPLVNAALQPLRGPKGAEDILKARFGPQAITRAALLDPASPSSDEAAGGKPAP
jgi:DNA repair protein SbcD/Mre11